jgi:hypothetical protein
MSRENEKWEGGNETLSRGERESHLLTLPTQAMRSRHVSSASKLPDTPGSHLCRVGPSDLVLRPKPRKPSSDGFVGKPPNPACSDRPPAKPLDSTATVHRLDCPLLRLARLATMWPAPSPAVHRVPRTEPTCLSISRRPFKAEDLSRPFFTCNNTN